MGHVRFTDHIDVPPDQAFALAIDASREPEWNNSIVEAKDVHGMLDTVGAGYTAVMKLGGRRLEARWEVSKVEKPGRLDLTGSAPGGGRATSATHFEPAAGGTDVTVEVDYELPGGFAGSVADKLFVERAIERDVKHSMENFKAILQAEAKVPA